MDGRRAHPENDPGERRAMGQKIALGVELEPYFAEEAKQRQGARTDLKEIVPSSDGKRRPESQSRDQAAAVVGVSGKTLSAAKVIRGWESRDARSLPDTLWPSDAHVRSGRLGELRCHGV